MSHDACILCVDDEIGILHSLKRLLRKEIYRVLTASSGQEALTILESEHVHVIISDERMPDMTGTELFSVILKKWPDIIRIILTGYADVDTISDAINKGHIYKFILKPWNDQNLRLEIRQALDQYALTRTNRKLQQTILEQNQILKNSNANLERAVRERTRELKLQNHALELSRTVLEALPLPVLGISSEGVVAVANENAMAFFSDEPEFAPGAEAKRFLSPQIIQAIALAIQENAPRVIRPSPEKPAISVTPLRGRFLGAGAVLLFTPPIKNL
ncbi:response regulator [Desulfobotulus sp. H1]|uniref:Response regulator n=1 Tax=Desulfobotulus pelophilus TaxID=2823377 RepID=A0ABT3N879_9BACT|nr:response regulator [Desulfobotulus pelophilus]MCW7753242.1 response regulator [Desulfobotulus pelophilus]